MMHHSWLEAGLAEAGILVYDLARSLVEELAGSLVGDLDPFERIIFLRHTSAS